jgi:rare lipoprotein A
MINFYNLIIALVFALFMLVSGCTSITRDGPPPYNVDVSNIPDAVPKMEKLSKYGNQPAYSVFGKRYYILASSKNYEEQGIASWYGTRFHARRTSSGEPYNMLSMTAAHRTLPLPTYVQVTNLGNGKKVIVKVNDRGPFESNRIIDLSYVAAKKLGMLGRGTALVDVKAIDPSEQIPRMRSITVYSLKANNNIYVQAGAFSNKHLAEKFRTRLQLKISSPIIITRSKHKRPLYLVKIGPITNTASVKHIHEKLKTMGIKL